MTLGGLIGAAPAPGKGWREAVRVREARGGVRSGAVGWWVFVVRAEPRRADRVQSRLNIYI